jgi:hypothetical protein
MPDRSDEYRRAAAQCLALACATTDPVTRVKLLIMAQTWYDRANGPPINFDAVQRIFNQSQVISR